MNARRRPPAPTMPQSPLGVPMATEWARERIAAGRELGEVPEYGSPAWAALADEDPRKLAAAVTAAEVYRYEVATLAERLAVELDEARRVAAREEAERERELSELARRTIDSVARRIVAKPCPPFSDPTPVVDTPDWPTVVKPPAPERPSTVQMIRALADPA